MLGESSWWPSEDLLPPRVLVLAHITGCGGLVVVKQADL